MTTLATRADLDAPRGSSYIDELLREAFAASDSPVDKDAKAQARLDAALADADAMIRRHLDARRDWPSYPAEDLANLRPLARDLAILLLRERTKAGSADEAIRERQKEIEKTLLDMRERRQWTGTTVFQQPVASAVVESGSPFSMPRLRGLV